MTGHVRRRGDRWQARFRGPDKRERAATFDRKRDAEEWLAAQATSIARGQFVDPSLGRRSFADYVERWRAASVAKKPKTMRTYNSVISNHLMPRLEFVPVNRIERSTVRELVAELVAEGKQPGTVRNIVFTLSAVLELAVEDGAIGTNPCRGVELPRSDRDEMRFLTPVEVDDLAEAIGHGLGPWVRFMAYSGLRFSEAAGLRVRRFDPLRARVDVVEQLQDVSGRLVWGPTKTNNRRSVTVPRSIAEAIAADLAGRAGDPDATVFVADRGGPLRNGNTRRVFDRAVAEVGLEQAPRMHDLRHTAVALAVAAGAHPTAIKERMGHASITTTLDRYGHLFPTIAEDLADDLDRMAADAADRPRTARVADVVDLSRRASGEGR